MIGVIVMQGMCGIQPDLPLSKPWPQPASAASLQLDSFRSDTSWLKDDLLTLLGSGIISRRPAAMFVGFQLFF